MAVYETVILDQNNLPVAGAQGYIYVNGSLAALTDDFGQPLENPILTDANGRAKATVPYSIYIVRWYWGGKERLVEDIVPAVGADVLTDVSAKVNEAAIWADAAASQAGAAGGYSSNASAQASTATAQATLASLYASAAAAYSNGFMFDTAAEGVSQGVISLTITAGGSTGTNGQFALAFSGGAGTGAAGTFTVSGGAVTTVNLTKRGKSYTGAPTVSLAASAGLTGATVTASIGNYAVPDGEYYLVKGSGNTWATLYKNVGGVATSQALEFPSLGSITALAGVASSTDVAENALTATGRNFDITDNEGRILFGFDAVGAPSLSAEFVRSLIKTTGIDTTALAVKALPRLGNSQVFTDWRGVMIGGQSNGTGADVATSTTQPHNSQRLNSLNTALIPLVETTYESHATAFAAETVMHLRDEMRPWDVYAPTQIVNNMSASGKILADLSKGTTYYNGGITDVTTIKNLATAAGKTYREYALHWLHGETDSRNSLPQATYLSQMLQLKNDWNTDVLAITGQTNRIPMFVIQLGYNGPSGYSFTTGPTLAQLEAAETDSEVFIIAPGYQFSFVDSSHYNVEDQRRIGAYFEKAHWRYFVLNRNPSTVRPLSIKRIDARTIDITFYVPVPPLVWDTETVWPIDKDMGFQVLRADTPIAIQGSPRIVSPNTVRLRMSADIQVGDTVTYAIKVGTNGKTGGINGGRMCSARGNLRDSDTTVSSYQLDADGKPFELPNWCVTFSKAVA